MSRSRPFHVLARDPVAGGSHEEWTGWLDAEGLHVAMSHPPAHQLEVRFLLPGADAESRAGAEVVRVDRAGEVFLVHLRLAGLGEQARAHVARFLGES